jgi:hypothetical protein
MTTVNVKKLCVGQGMVDAMELQSVDSLEDNMILNVKEPVFMVERSNNVPLPNGPLESAPIQYPTQKRILLLGQTNKVENGIYIVSEDGVWSRTSDFLTQSDADGAIIYMSPTITTLTNIMALPGIIMCDSKNGTPGVNTLRYLSMRGIFT